MDREHEMVLENIKLYEMHKHFDDYGRIGQLIYGVIKQGNRLPLTGNPVFDYLKKTWKYGRIC